MLYNNINLWRNGNVIQIQNEQHMTLPFKYGWNITDPMHEIIRNNRLLKKAKERNQTTHDLKLKNNGTGTKWSTRTEPLAFRDALLWLLLNQIWNENRIYVLSIKTELHWSLFKKNWWSKFKLQQWISQNKNNLPLGLATLSLFIAAKRKYQRYRYSLR